MNRATIISEESRSIVIDYDISSCETSIEAKLLLVVLVLSLTRKRARSEKKKPLLITLLRAMKTPFCSLVLPYENNLYFHFYILPVAFIEAPIREE